MYFDYDDDSVDDAPAETMLNRPVALSQHLHVYLSSRRTITENSSNFLKLFISVSNDSIFRASYVCVHSSRVSATSQLKLVTKKNIHLHPGNKIKLFNNCSRQLA